MLTVFFDWEGVVHHEYTPPGQTINKEYYFNVLPRLREAIEGKLAQLWATGDWQLYHDKVPAHALGLIQFLVKHQIIQVTQPPCSPGLVPCDFWPFPKLKSPLRGKRLQTINEIQENTTGQLMVTGRIVWGPKVPPLKGTKGSLSYVQCFLYLLQ